MQASFDINDKKHRCHQINLEISELCPHVCENLHLCCKLKPAVNRRSLFTKEWQDVTAKWNKDGLHKNIGERNLIVSLPGRSPLLPGGNSLSMLSNDQSNLHAPLPAIQNNCCVKIGQKQLFAAGWNNQTSFDRNLPKMCCCNCTDWIYHALKWPSVKVWHFLKEIWVLKFKKDTYSLIVMLQTQRTILQDCIIILMSRQIPDVSSQVYLDA